MFCTWNIYVCICIYVYAVGRIVLGKLHHGVQPNMRVSRHCFPLKFQMKYKSNLIHIENLLLNIKPTFLLLNTIWNASVKAINSLLISVIVLILRCIPPSLSNHASTLQTDPHRCPNRLIITLSKPLVQPLLKLPDWRVFPFWDEREFDGIKS